MSVEPTSVGAAAIAAAIVGKGLLTEPVAIDPSARLLTQIRFGNATSPTPGVELELELELEPDVPPSTLPMVPRTPVPGENERFGLLGFMAQKSRLHCTSPCTGAALRFCTCTCPA